MRIDVRGIAVELRQVGDRTYVDMTTFLAERRISAEEVDNMLWLNGNDADLLTARYKLAPDKIVVRENGSTYFFAKIVPLVLAYIGIEEYFDYVEGLNQHRNAAVAQLRERLAAQAP